MKMLLTGAAGTGSGHALRALDPRLPCASLP